MNVWAGGVGAGEAGAGGVAVETAGIVTGSAATEAIEGVTTGVAQTRGVAEGLESGRSAVGLETGGVEGLIRNSDNEESPVTHLSPRSILLDPYPASLLEPYFLLVPVFEMAEDRESFTGGFGF